MSVQQVEKTVLELSERSVAKLLGRALNPYEKTGEWFLRVRYTLPEFSNHNAAALKSTFNQDNPIVAELRKRSKKSRRVAKNRRVKNGRDTHAKRSRKA